ncbi:efflux RND transporter periplasmic adaptor subunit [Aquimarina sp. AD1]|uniref:efflux RND transporter periplasmic adaptor subunit n=1 Tax=Aquimarina sp. (strain AD1) TaxID=1714848 RepID=UPI000E534853|nr:efflux RND transporter periplasmic adaptor subunit [Aquimarina sp. AD1]AXT57840.1 efflux RND transporter periplasmic adaptor subunit [Aquimarina sp. AD1]RKN35000.1 efflux RND transporter periplasmic adaptor subunit [Aquimarina sp. AD1]
MKKTITVIILLLIVVVFGGALYYLYQKNQEDPVTYKTEQSTTETIIKKTVATGSIVPKEEVLIKPNISGIIEEIYIEAGDQIKSGDLIAKIRVIPNVSSLQSAKNAVQTAKIDLDNQEKVFNRQKELFDKGVISANEFDGADVTYKQSRQNYEAAQQNYQIVRTGTTRGLGSAANTLIRSTVTGMILEVPVKQGNQVIESNNFNDGTTIAAVADVGQMIFEGNVDESEVGKIKENLPLEITVGAIENKKFDAVLDYIAPKGKEENGAIQFEIKGTLNKKDTTFIRAGLSANASIILAKVDSVMALKESLIQYDPKTQKPFVEVAIGEQEFENRDVELGVSDGINVEVKSGITKEDKIKVWNQIKKPEFGN